MSTKFSPTPAELALVSQIFVHADPQKHGILTGDVAVRVFGGANLKPTVLGEIWSIADEDNNGFLPRKGVAIAIRLMGWAQKGEKVTPALVNKLLKAGPLPTIEGITAVTQQNTGVSSPRSPPPGLPPLTPQDKAKFQALFMKSGPANGLLSGEKSRDFFVKSGLSNEKLLQIWNLADTQDRGALDSTDFAIGMYFIQGLMSGQLSFIPTSLPPGLYQQAGGNPAINQGNVGSHMTGQSGSFSPMSASFPQNQSRGYVQPQYTGQTQLQPEHTGFSTAQSKPPVLPARPITSNISSPPFPLQRNGHLPQWDVTPTEKANSDRFFDELDIQRRGYIEGEVAVPFMLKSNLPGEVLAQVWDLADINNDGRLTREGFAVAMYLIQKLLAGNEIPTTLPPSLIPPSMRTSTASPFLPVAQQAAPEPPKDLLWDDIQPTTTTIPSHQTGPASSTFPLASTSVTQDRDPFGSTMFSSTSHHQDLLGDDDDTGHSSPPLHDQSAEIGNTQNQLNSTNRSLDTANRERVSVEQTLANQASQLSALQTQLSSAKVAYETETKLLATLKDRHSNQMAEMQKSREELIRAESDLSAIRVEKSEVEGAFLRDKEEARELHRRMVETSQQAEALKLEVEKAKKDAKQQKGLLAIARKQLSTKEAEKAKVEKELDEANAEFTSVVKDKDTAEAELAQLSAIQPIPVNDLERKRSSDTLTFAAGQALPVSPDPASPTSSAKSNNPFDRLTKSPGQSSPRSQSPFLPFSGASVPMPSTNGVTTDSSSNISTFDPFGFSQTFNTNQPPQDDLRTASPSASRTSTPKPVDIGMSGTQPMFSPSSPSESDQFVTPPTTANSFIPQATPPPSGPAESAVEIFPVPDDAASHFPDLEGVNANNHFPTARIEGSHDETDLSAGLKELDVDDSDSDSDSDDGVPLANLAKGKGNVTGPPLETTPTTEQAEAPALSFDDIFGITPPTGVSPPETSGDGTSDATKTFAGSPSKSSSITTTTTTTATTAAPSTEAHAPAVAGVNAFDEAMGAIPNSVAPNTTQHFTFDSAFDDNFDFASATETTFPQAPTNITTTGSKNNGFDSVFMTPPRSGAPVIPFIAAHDEPVPSTLPLLTETPTNPDTHKPTLDEAFSGFEPGPTLSLQGSFSSPTTQETSHAHSSTNSPIQMSFPVSTGPVSPKAESVSPHVVPPRSVSPSPRAKSPPLRIASPKPRLSSSSSKDTPEKSEEPTARRSKLSIRLPFGKKKKQQQHQEPLPAPPSHLLTPTVEEIRSISPAVDDDVEAVKQLTAMGFSRTQAVSALEKYGYDVQKALNSLLGAP